MDLAERLSVVDAGITDAARAAGRDPASITRIVVTKFHPASLVVQLYDLGVRDVGENRQQELSEKSLSIGPRDGLRWHFIGQAQTNKARAVRAAASVVHSVDRVKIANALDTAAIEDAAADEAVLDEAAILDVLIQVNLTTDPGRGGVAESDLDHLAEHVSGCRSLRLCGVMGVAPLDEQPAAAFARLRSFSERLRTIAPEATWISAGMTADYAEAIAAGATHLRIGSAITGPRPEHG